VYGPAVDGSASVALLGGAPERLDGSVIAVKAPPVGPVYVAVHELRQMSYEYEPVMPDPRCELFEIVRFWLVYAETGPAVLPLTVKLGAKFVTVNGRPTCVTPS
jgi:hypothetical protein